MVRRNKQHYSGVVVASFLHWKIGKNLLSIRKQLAIVGFYSQIRGVMG